MRIIEKGWTRVLFFIPVRYYIVEGLRDVKGRRGEAWFIIPPTIYIDASCKDDILVWEHELQHIRQWILSLGLVSRLPDELCELDAQITALIKNAKKRKLRKKEYLLWEFFIENSSHILEDHGISKWTVKKYLKRKLKRTLGLEI